MGNGFCSVAPSLQGVSLLIHPTAANVRMRLAASSCLELMMFSDGIKGYFRSMGIRASRRSGVMIRSWNKHYYWISSFFMKIPYS